MICKFCQKECKNSNSHRNHERLCRNNPLRTNVPTGGNRKGCLAWNKGLTKETSDLVKKISESVSRTTKGRARSIPITLETRKKLSKIAIERNFGCQNKNRYAHGWYESPTAGRVWLESSYEFRVAQELDAVGIVWIRPAYLMYVLDGRERKYFADFYLPNYGVYLDPKNDFLIKKDQRKISAVVEQNSVRVLVLTSNQLTWSIIGSLV